MALLKFSLLSRVIQSDLKSLLSYCQDKLPLLPVFSQKVVMLMDLFTKYNIFSLTRCDMYSIEWQKHGLLHNNILLWLQHNSVLLILTFIRAELSSQQEDPELHEIKHVVHGPCGRFNPNSPCMQDGKCTKKLPEASLERDSNCP